MNLIQKICVWAIPVLLAIVGHEVAHGWVAYKFGDKTALMLGRLSFNPLKHIDPIGTILVPGVLLFLGGFIFGWAKPVPINPRNFRYPRGNMAVVSLAGPVANLIMAFFWAVVMKLGLYFSAHGIPAIIALMYMGQAGIFINLMLAILNLIPLPPLDGGQFVSNLLPPKQAYYFDKIQPFGFLILLILLATGLLGKIMAPFFFISVRFIFNLFGLN